MLIRHTLATACALFVFGAFAQEPPAMPPPPRQVMEGEIMMEPIPEPKSERLQEAQQPQVYTVVEQMPEFPGGTAKLMQYLQKNIVYPQEAVEAGIEGRVFVQFVVDQEGNIRDVKVLRGVPGGPMMDKEAVRVVKGMPKWNPGMQNGRKVSTYYNLPVVFKLTSTGK